MSKSKSTRESRAMELLEAGKIALFVGKGYAVATGSKGETYRVTKQGCECPDFRRRQQACKHITATTILCELARAARRDAETGKVRLPAVLAKALANATSAPAPARKSVIIADDQSDLFNPYTLDRTAA